MRGVTINPVVRTRDRNGPLTCTVAGCDAEVKAKGLCKMHYARLLRHGHVKTTRRTQPVKACTVPGCSNHLYAKGMCNQHYLRSTRNTQRYGLSLDDLDRMAADQDNCCAICRGDQTRTDWRSGKKNDLVVDHCHSTNLVRSLLCDPCNRAIGLLGDDPERLEAAAAYIRRHAFLHSLPAQTPAADRSARDYLTLLVAPAAGPPS